MTKCVCWLRIRNVRACVRDGQVLARRVRLYKRSLCISCRRVGSDRIAWTGFSRTSQIRATSPFFGTHQSFDTCRRVRWLPSKSTGVEHHMTWTTPEYASTAQWHVWCRKINIIDVGIGRYRSTSRAGARFIRQETRILCVCVVCVGQKKRTEPIVTPVVVRNNCWGRRRVCIENHSC